MTRSKTKVQYSRVEGSKTYALKSYFELPQKILRVFALAHVNQELASKHEKKKEPRKQQCKNVDQFLDMVRSGPFITVVHDEIRKGLKITLQQHDDHKQFERVLSQKRRKLGVERQMKNYFK